MIMRIMRRPADELQTQYTTLPHRTAIEKRLYFFPRANSLASGVPIVRSRTRARHRNAACSATEPNTHNSSSWKQHHGWTLWPFAHEQDAVRPLFSMRHTRAGPFLWVRHGRASLLFRAQATRYAVHQARRSGGPRLVSPGKFVSTPITRQCAVLRFRHSVRGSFASSYRDVDYA